MITPQLTRADWTDLVDLARVILLVSDRENMPDDRLLICRMATAVIAADDKFKRLEGGGDEQPCERRSLPGAGRSRRIGGRRQAGEIANMVEKKARRGYDARGGPDA